MAKKVIDISQFNTVTDWSKVKTTGYPVIIRIAYRGSKTGIITYDPKYQKHKQAVEKYNIPHSYYFFPCSITRSEAHEEALFIKNNIDVKKLDLPVFLDSQVVQKNKSGRSDKLSKAKRTELLKIICDDLLSFGIPCGIYASRSWLYNNLDMSQIAPEANDNTWVAEYGVSKHKYTGKRILWQYTSKGSVPGISGNVDLSTFEGIPNMAAAAKSEEKTQPKKEKTPTSASQIDLIINTAKEELGYLEKKSNSSLDDKTANAGYNNYTKYWRDIKPDFQAQPWCAAFVSWVFMKALGQARAKELLKHWPYVYCPTMKGLFTLNANPKVGDIVIFWRNNVFAHTGIVIAVDGDKFTTIEGNTSGASGVVDNGGGVCQKQYYNSKLPGTKFCRPAYKTTNITQPTNQVVVADDIHTAKWKGRVTASSLNVRMQAKLSAKTCSFSPLKKGTEVGVCYQQGEWYLIKYNGKFGYVYYSYIQKI